MKARLCAALLALVLITALFSGCQLRPANTPDNTPAEAVANQPENQAAYTPEENTSKATLLTKEEAQTIALTHAGLSAGQVTRMHAEFDWDDGVPEYDVEFHYDLREYEYEIHAQTGEIRQAPRIKNTSTNTEEAPADEPKQLSKEDAQAAALAHAGLSADQVSELRTEYGIDDGVPEYEVEFRHDRWEYDYEIHAETGKILSWDKDD